MNLSTRPARPEIGDLAPSVMQVMNNSKPLRKLRALEERFADRSRAQRALGPRVVSAKLADERAATEAVRAGRAKLPDEQRLALEAERRELGREMQALAQAISETRSALLVEARDKAADAATDADGRVEQSEQRARLALKDAADSIEAISVARSEAAWWRRVEAADDPREVGAFRAEVAPAKALGGINEALYELDVERGRIREREEHAQEWARYQERVERDEQADRQRSPAPS